MTAFQDCFVDPDGTCYVYEISVRHCEARGYYSLIVMGRYYISIRIHQACRTM